MQLNRGNAAGQVKRPVSGRRAPATTTQLLRSASPKVDPVCTIEVATPSGASATLSAPSGEILRRTLIDNKQELYQGMWAKAMNCGGSGSCGTCVVEVGGPPCSPWHTPPHAARFPESQGPERPDTDPVAVAAAPTTAVTEDPEPVCTSPHLRSPSVQVKDDSGQLLSERTATEVKKLQGKPASWRLACQTVVGDGESSGACKVMLGPR